MTITRIVDDLDTRLDVYMRLSDRQLRSLVDPTQAKIIVESHFAVRLAARLGLDFESILIDERHLDSLLPELEEYLPKDTEIFIAERDILSKIVGFDVTRGYFACVKRPEAPKIDDILDGAKRVAVLEGIVDVSNIGALFRSAAALGIDALLLSPNCADPYSRRAIRTSMGTVFQVPWTKAEGVWPEDLSNKLKDLGFYQVALALKDDAVSIESKVFKDKNKLALYFGSEGFGLSDKALACADKTAIIPMTEGIDSLNVAASSAVVFWELCHKR